MNYRYGNFRFGDYYLSWIGILVLLTLSVLSIVFELSLLFILFPTAYAIVWLLAILVPHHEQFVICKDFIHVSVGSKSHSINLPEELTLVVSNVDICPPLAIRTAFGNETHILKDKYAVSILQEVSLDDVLEGLHCNSIRKYTSSRIQTVFNDYHFIYSFVYNQTSFNELVNNKKCLLIIPESLLSAIKVDANIVNMYIDTGY